MARTPVIASIVIVIGAGACDDMTKQPRQEIWDKAPAETRNLPAGQVSFEKQVLAPPPVTLALLQRGQERYHINCAPCHSELGDGRGMIVQRGFSAPSSFHIARLREAPPQHFYDVITDGYGAMYSFAARVAPRDRWAVAAYIKALQRSQNATVAEVPDANKGAVQ